jgi:hypothetical protein
VSSGGVSKDAFKALHAPDSGMFEKVETGHADTFELKPEDPELPPSWRGLRYQLAPPSGIENTIDQARRGRDGMEKRRKTP